MEMNTRYFSPLDSTFITISASLSTNNSPSGDEHSVTTTARNRVSRSSSASSSSSSSSFLLRMAMRISRARWFMFLRRVFHYQNGSRSDLGSNPFNSWTWMVLELIALIVQISVSSFTLGLSQHEKPVWPVRIWVIGYDVGCCLGLLLLYGRYRQLYRSQGDGFSIPDLEQQRGIDGSRYSHLMNKCRTSLDLFFAIWFVMGNVWVFDSRFGSFHRAPKLHILCISLLAWNALCYSFPFLLFLLLCCCVPLISSLLGYNMNMTSIGKGASDDQISSLPSWRYKAIESVEVDCDCSSSVPNKDQECCICLSKYKDKEEVRQLPCLHVFHLKCVDKWLRIISCCPLCKQELER